MTRTGIFLCTCDRKIDKSVDVEQVDRAFDGEAVVIPIAHVCLPDGMRSLRSDIVENGFERVVIAACPPRLQEKRLRDVCMEAGVNLNRFALVDWREGCAWAHRGDKEGATVQAIDLVRMGLGRVTEARPLDGVLARIAPGALVVGGGIAGLTAARALADRGIVVTLVERESELGGQLIRVPLNGHAETFETTRREVLDHPGIDVRLSSRVVTVRGAVGNYHVEIAGPQAQDNSTVIAGAVVIATGATELRDPRLYRHDGRRIVTLSEFEAILSNPSTMTTLRPQSGIRNSEFGIQQPSFSNQHSAPPPTRDLGAFRIPHSIVFILCAGSRDEHIPYCSNVCCLGALNQAVRVKKANPTANVTILFRDLYLLDDELNEEVVRETRQAGVEFVRYAASTPPRVEDDFVVVRDTAGLTRWLGYDRLVLATPLVPREDAGVVANLFNLARDQDGFFPDPHWRLRPEQQAESGIFVCGSAHRPVDVDTAVMQGLTAAARAARFIHRREVMRPASSAWVDTRLCTGCAQCISTCPVGAITLVPYPLVSPHASPDGMPRETSKSVEQVGRDGASEVRSVVDPFLCLACGNCAAECPVKAIDLPTASDAMIFAQIDAGLGNWGDGETAREGTRPGVPVSPSLRVPASFDPGPRMPVPGRVLVFGCQWSGLAAMELAGARRLKYPANVRVIGLPCSARLDPMHVLYAFLGGADSVIVALCPPGECHFASGNKYAEARVEKLRADLAVHGIDPQRLQVARMMGDDAAAWVKAIEEVSGRRAQGMGDKAQAHA